MLVVQVEHWFVATHRSEEPKDRLVGDHEISKRRLAGIEEQVKTLRANGSGEQAT